MFTLTNRRAIDVVAYFFLLWSFVRTVTLYFFPYKQPLSRYRRRVQAYAVILDVESQVGIALAQQLISYGFGIIYVTGIGDKVGGLMKQLRLETPGAFIDIVEFDIRSHSLGDLTAVLQPITNRQVTILINCLNGLNAPTQYQTILTSPGSDVDNLIDRGVRFTSQVSRILLPTLVRNGPSLIVHILSETIIGYPYMSMYSAVQGFAASNAAALKREAKAEDWQLDSLAVVIGDLNARGLPSTYADWYAKLLLDRVEISVDRGFTLVRPYWLDALQHKLFESVPERLIQALIQRRATKTSEISLKHE